VVVIEITETLIAHRAHLRMDNDKPILGVDCPACDRFVPALPIHKQHSRWEWYMHCACGVIFYAEKTHAKPDAAAVEA